MRDVRPILIALLVAALPAIADAQSPSSEQMNEANSPLTSKVTLNLHDYYTSDFYELDDSDANQVLFRGVLPHRLLGLPQILRGTMPLVTSPDEPSGSVTGSGDLNLYNLFIVETGGFDLGFGPQLTAPTASDDRLGTGKWQAGVAGVAIAPLPWGLLGGLVTWQHSFAGEDDRGTQNNLTTQPFIIFNLPDGYYLRSTAIMSFDLERGDYVVPIGLGGGKVWNLGRGTTLNAFVEPQYSVAHEGVQPKFQVFLGLNLQFTLAGE